VNADLPHAPSTRQRGFAVAAVRALGSRAEALIARRFGETSPLCPLAAELARDPERLLAEARRLDAPRPAGLAEVHPSWYEAPPASARPEAQDWLDRRAFGELVPLEGSPELSEDALVDRGRREVATAFLSASRAQIARLCARLGEPHATRLIDELRRVAAHATREQVRAARQRLHALEDGLFDESGAAFDGPALFLLAGCAKVAPSLAARGEDALRALALRLPASIGRRLLLLG
jgi:hypothetical protein